LDGFVGTIYCTRVEQTADVVALPKLWFGYRGAKGLSHFALAKWATPALLVAETPTVEQAGAFGRRTG